MKTLGYIVELEKGFYLSEAIQGDSGSTFILENATRYSDIASAEEALDRAKIYRVFPNHAIRPLYNK